MLGPDSAPWCGWSRLFWLARLSYTYALWHMDPYAAFCGWKAPAWMGAAIALSTLDEEEGRPAGEKFRVSFFLIVGGWGHVAGRPVPK